MKKSSKLRLWIFAVILIAGIFAYMKFSGPLSLLDTREPCAFGVAGASQVLATYYTISGYPAVDGTKICVQDTATWAGKMGDYIFFGFTQASGTREIRVLDTLAPVSAANPFIWYSGSPSMVDITSNPPRTLQSVKVMIDPGNNRYYYNVQTASTFQDEVWTCGAWSECVSGQKIRACAQADTSGRSLRKPAATENCVFQPVKPSPSGFSAFLDGLWNWIAEALKSVGLFSVTGSEQVEIGKTYQYQIDLQTAAPDVVFQDGAYQTQYAYWAVVDADKVVITGNTVGTEVFGNYSKSVSFTPSKSGAYVLTSFITQIDSKYDQPSGRWVNGNETVVVKEAKNIASQVTFTVPVKPGAGGIGGFLSGILAWLVGLFAGLFK